MTDTIGNPEEGKSTEGITGAYFAPGTSSEHERAVLYQGDYQHESDGTGVAIRLNVRALASAGLPVLLKPYSGLVLTGKGAYEPLHVAGVPEGVQAEVGKFVTTSAGSLYPAIRHFVCHKPEDISRRVMRGIMGGLDNPELLLKARQAAYGASVFYSVWERDRIDHATVREMNRMGDNWVPCEQNAEMLQSCGVKSVAVMPHPYDPENPLLKLTRRKPMDTKRFYWIGRWEPRKNPVEILWAFAMAIRPGEDAHLTMKHHGQWDDYPTFAQTVDRISKETDWTREDLARQVTSIEKILRPDQMLKLHFENNIYLAPSCGEAWCLPAFEAKLAGNTLIHTSYGGTADFCDGLDYAVPYTMQDVPSSYGWPPGSQWAKPNRTDLAIRMRGAPRGFRFLRPPDFEERFSLRAVGEKMRARLREKFGSFKMGAYL